jgi:hypothetical protein
VAVWCYKRASNTCANLSDVYNIEAVYADGERMIAVGGCEALADSVLPFKLPACRGRCAHMDRRIILMAAGYPQG